MEVKKFIYENALDAFSYAGTLLVSLSVPTIISAVTDQSIFMLVSLMINSMSLLRDYLLLTKFRKAYLRFWVERLLGIGVSALTLLYSIIAILCFINGFGQNVFEILNIIFAILFFIPVLISGVEGIIYIVQDFKDNVFHDEFVVATQTTVDV